MDPDACLERFASAVLEGDVEEAFDARVDLAEWIARGGFEPAWTATWPRQRFYAWYPEAP